MSRKLTVSEKRIIITISVLLFLSVITLFANIPKDILIWAYAAGTVFFVICAEIYIFYSYVSRRFENRFIHIMLRINGVPDNERTFVKVNGTLVQKYTGRYDGVFKLRGGYRDVTFFNKRFTVTSNIKVEEFLSVDVAVENSVAVVRTKLKELEGTEEELETRLKRFDRINLFVFFVANWCMFFSVLKILAIWDII